MNKDRDVPFTRKQIVEIARSFPTPFHIYNERQIRETARELNHAFSWNKGFKNYFAVKACPNPTIVNILREEGNGADCSSLTELLMAERVGINGQQIMFSSNNTPAIEFQHARRLGATINLDDITHIPYLEQVAGIPDTICFRYNPGPLRHTAKENVIGEPEKAKYGFTKDQLFRGYAIMKRKGVKHFGLQTMIASNELNPHAFVETFTMLAKIAVELKNELKIQLEFLDLGGGIGTPYRPAQNPVNFYQVSAGIQDAYQKLVVKPGLAPIKIFMENGRVMTGPSGFLVTTAIHEKHIYREYIGVDACMADLMRPGMYGAYHHMTVLGKAHTPVSNLVKYDVVGSLCENNDKFAIDRSLPRIRMGDLIVIHGAGAHGRAMCFNYNGKLRSGEVLWFDSSDTHEVIRRKETNADYFATFDYPGSKFRFDELLRKHGLE